MIATTRGLLVLAAIALLLGLAIIVVGPQTAATADRTLVPGFDPSHITELVIERPGERQPPIDLVLRQAPATKAPPTWRWHAPDGEADVRTITMHDEIPVDASAVDNLLAALRGARWHRSASISAAGNIRATLRVIANGKTIETIGIGADLSGAEQTWITRNGRARLVDAWAAHALAPSRLELRIKHPLAATPVDTRHSGIWIDPAVTQRVREAFDNVEYLSLDATRVSATFGPSIGTVRELGVCESDRVFLLAPVGNGCVDRTAWTTALGTLAELDKPAAQIADRRPLPFAPSTIVLPDGVTLQLAGRPRLGDSNTDADAERVRDLVAALGAPGELVARPTGAALGTLVATDAAGTQITLELYRDAVARKGEDVAIHTPQLATIAQGAVAYRDSTRWREDPTMVTSITIDGVTFTRGAVIGEWTRSAATAGSGAPISTTDAALVDALASAIATVRAPSTTTAPGRILHRVTVTITPPTGAVSTHKLELASPDPKGCPARVDGAPAQLPLELCTAVFALHP